MNDFLEMKNNLIQNFYVIGVPLEEIIEIPSLKTQEKSYDIYIDSSKIYTPQIISKFPPVENNMNKIIDELVINHCFPNNLCIKEGKKYGDYKYHFEFELDNKIYKYIDNNKYIYSKIHFTCLKFYESIKDYKKLKDFFGRLNENNNNENDNDINNILKINTEGSISSIGSNTIFYIPKVICFASLLPFHDELHKILINIYDYYKYQSIKNSKKNAIYSSVEKIIEQIVMKLPLPIKNNNDIILNFNIEPDNSGFNINNKILTYSQIYFESYDLRDFYLNKCYNLSMIDIFLQFSEEDVIKIFKNILFENPILFFCEDKQLLSNVMEGFLNILSPFRYVLPYITILPSKFYGLIHSQDKFIFGINQKYNKDFFRINEISINKNIIIISLKKGNNNINQIEEVSKKNEGENNKKLYITQNTEENDKNFPTNLNEIDLPVKHKKKLLLKLKTYLNSIKNNIKKDKIDPKFNTKIRHIFHKFFINILSGYTEYLLKCPNHKYYGNNVRQKYNGKNGLLKYIKEIFDYDKFISNFPKDSQMFYKAFFNTTLFFNFIRGIIYPTNEIDSLRHKFFDLMTFLKKNKDLRNDEYYKDQYEKQKKPFETKKTKSKKIIVISDKYYFNDEEKKILNDENNRKKALFEYYQLIEIDKNKDIKDYNKINQNLFLIKYFLFPKLLFDNKFFKQKYNIQFFKHYIELPNDNIIKELNKSLEISEKDYLSKYCSTVYPKASNINLKMSLTNFFFGQTNTLNSIINSSSQNIIFDLCILSYVEYNWLLLLSCSLWYCSSQKEKEIRINKIFDILEKLDYVEEQALYFVFYSLYKYSNIPQFIRIFEYLKRFIGSYSYYDLLLLFQKLENMKRNNNSNLDIDLNNDKDNKIITQKRSFFDVTSNIYKTESESENKKKEEITFNIQQICKECKNVNEMNKSDILNLFNRKIDKSKKNFNFKCKKCGLSNTNLKINYNIFLCDIKKNKDELIKQGSFNLIMPHLLFQEIKNYVINLKDNNIDIDHIFSNKNINLLNFIFYFSLNGLPFDFLIPYENKTDREYFNDNYLRIDEEEDEEESKPKNKFSCLVFSKSNDDNFSFNGINNN